MAAERREPRGSFFPPGGRTSRYGRVHTPMPESRERVTESGLDAREVGTADLRSPEPVGRADTGRDSLTERVTEENASALGASSLGASSLPVSGAVVSRDAPTEPASAPDEDVTEFPYDSATKSVGFYSIRPSRGTSIEIPRAPRVPELDLDGLDLPPDPLHSSVRARRVSSTPPETLRSDSSYPETVRTPPPDAIVPRVRASARVPGSSAPPPPMQGAQTLTPPAQTTRGQRRSSYPAPRIFFASHVRSQANDWAQTGALSLPGCSSPRHARALQRALLLALLHEPGWECIPQGLQHRAGWLFCDGWESNSDGHASREIDDLATVLGLPAGKDSRRLLSLAIAGVLPEGLSVRRAPSSAPPTRR